MTKIEFVELSQNLQLVELFSNAIYLDYIIQGVYMVKLFQIENFYVNTYYHIEKNRFDSIIAFDDTDKLTPFLKKKKLVIQIAATPPPSHR
jgi:hypothetical protein